MIYFAMIEDYTEGIECSKCGEKIITWFGLAVILFDKPLKIKKKGGI